MECSTGHGEVVESPVLEVTGLCKAYGGLTVCDRVDLQLLPGELHALIGPNGAGKTTLLNLISGLLTPDSGRIRFLGRDITSQPLHHPDRQGMARSFQITSVFPGFTVQENIALAVQVRAGNSFSFWRNTAADPDLQEPATEIMERIGLAARRGVRAADLSHGEQRQLEIAMALALRPRLLLLDEPMAGLGPGGTRKLTDLIETLKGEMTIFLVEHDMDAVFSLADRISVLVQGTVAACGDPASIRRDTRVREAYLGGTERAAAD